MILTTSTNLLGESGLEAIRVPKVFERPLRTIREYPERALVPSSQRLWDKECGDYRPPFYESDRLRAQDRTRIAGGWADPSDVSREEFLRWSRIGYMRSFEGPIRHDPETGRPLNPLGRMGIQGRGVLGKWGPNHAADAIVTRIGPESKKLELILVRRKSGEWAFPGGMIDDGETSIEAAIRELSEETYVDMDSTKHRLVFRGIGDGPRVTDNAWVETTAYHFHLTNDSPLINVVPIPSEEVDDAKWEVITPELLSNLYANHGEILGSALKQFLLNERTIDGITQAQIESIPHSPLLTTFSQMKGKIGILGGSFDPLHIGHLSMSERAIKNLGLDAVVYVPTSHNPLKGRAMSSLPRERLDMAMYALADSPKCFVSPIEILYEGESYTIDTLQRLKAECESDDVKFYLLIGSDCLSSLPEWKEIDELIADFQIVPISRGGEKDLLSDPHLREKLEQRFGVERVQGLVEHSIITDQIAVSSTELRDQIGMKDFPNSLTVPSVSEYVILNDLYSISTRES